MKKLNIFHFLSLDVATGVLIQAFAIQKFSGYLFPSDFFLLLPLNVLWIYWLDRLLDVYKLTSEQLLEAKHIFYKQHFQWISVLCGVLVIYVSIKGLFFSINEIKILGLLSGIWILFYFFIHHYYKGNSKLLFFKETMIAFTYSFVLWILPIIYQFDWTFILAFFCLFLIALLNLWIISLWDYEIDIKLKTHSFAQIQNSIFLLNILFVLTLFSLILLFFFSQPIGITYFIMWLTHLILYLKPKNDISRVSLELTFWLPVLTCFLF